jgi:hypothetical protein
LLSLFFLFNKIVEEEGETCSARKWEVGRERRRGEVVQTMYTYVSKCKNDKIKGRKEKERGKMDAES